MRPVRHVMLCLMVSALVTSGAGAQPLAGTFVRLFDLSTVNRTSPNPANPAVNIVHEPHFIVGESLKQTTREMNVALAAQLASFPLRSSSGGFSFSSNQRGEVVTTSTTFGPRSRSARSRSVAGSSTWAFSFQATNYDTFEGSIWSRAD